MRTLVLLKPDAGERNLVGEIISRFEKKGFKIVAMKRLKLSEEQAREFYSVHKGKHFYESLVSYIISGPVLALVLEGDNIISQVRELMGSTDPRKAAEGTIRKDFGISIEKNTVHGSDSEESAAKEIPIIFSEDEIIEG